MVSSLPVSYTHLDVYKRQGLDSAKAFCEAHPELDAYFICSGEGDKYETYFTDGMKKFIASEK